MKAPLTVTHVSGLRVAGLQSTSSPIDLGFPRPGGEKERLSSPGPPSGGGCPWTCRMTAHSARPKAQIISLASRPRAPTCCAS